jgi:hypothetical protein
LGTWARRERQFALLAAALTLLVGGLGASVLVAGGVPAFATVPVVIAAAAAVYLAVTRRIRRRRRLLQQPFPPAWEAVLQRDVAFFRALPPAEQARFRRAV